MEIRPARPDDADGIAQVITEAFGAEGAGVAAIWRDLGELVHVSLVAVDGPTILGHVGLSHGWLDARRALVDVLVLSPLSVAPGAQGAGLGTRLVSAALDAAAATGRPAVFLEGDPGYYGRRGFERASGRGFEAPSRRTPDAAFQVALLDSHEDWMTGRVVYPDVWWRHDAAGLRDPLLAELEERFG